MLLIITTTAQAGLRGFKHRGTCPISMLTLMWNRKATRDNISMDTADVTFFLVAHTDPARGLTCDTNTETLRYCAMH
jgi:hypothetical protein